MQMPPIDMMMTPSRKSQRSPGHNKKNTITNPSSRTLARHSNRKSTSIDKNNIPPKHRLRQTKSKKSGKKKNPKVRKSLAVVSGHHGGADSNSGCVGTVPALNSSGSTSTVNWGTPQELPGLVMASQGSLQRVDGSMFGLDQPGLLLGTYSGIL